jgi:hypothetical protein
MQYPTGNPNPTKQRALQAGACLITGSTVKQTPDTYPGNITPDGAQLISETTSGAGTALRSHKRQNIHIIYLRYRLRHCQIKA